MTHVSEATFQADQPMEESEGVLLAELRAGLPAAFERLVRTHTGRVLGVAMRILRCESDAYDVVQETFLNAFRSLEQFQGASSLSTWLHRIAVNSALMKLRSRSRRHEVAIEDLLPRFHRDGHREAPVVAWRECETSAEESRETATLVRRLIDRLPEDYRTVLLLRDVEELRTGEVAEMLGISAGAVKVRLHRARQALRELLEPHRRRGSL